MIHVKLIWLFEEGLFFVSGVFYFCAQVARPVCSTFPLMTSTKAETTARKRKAAAMLQELALELGVPKLPGGADLAVPAFNALHTSVKEKC